MRQCEIPRTEASPLRAFAGSFPHAMELMVKHRRPGNGVDPTRRFQACHTDTKGVYRGGSGRASSMRAVARACVGMRGDLMGRDEDALGHLVATNDDQGATFKQRQSRLSGCPGAHFLLCLQIWASEAPPAVKAVTDVPPDLGTCFPDRLRLAERQIRPGRPRAGAAITVAPGTLSGIALAGPSETSQL
jgi:hypothetical protein